MILEQRIKIVIIIITGETALLEPWSSLEDSASLYPVFTSLDFAKIFSSYRAKSSAMRPTPNLEDQDPVSMSTSGRVAELYTQIPSCIFSSSVTRRAKMEVF
jgi:hypothetical protein